ncbi:lipopolysaccharide export system permease protein [Parapedobacter composti]|uniref:Lipopolysaccharide export system permease protein n=1 Tax=Parapedobacter composti TaxID=623281 RepID=A0A1I1HTA8_9SPHI|nr:LptF/LptG family permease [Parapedobacter composti]SFC27379.1 lipopolysaccharide export system permease protein [Parapedobacter composti]
MKEWLQSSFKIIDRYVIQKYLSTFVFTMGIFTVVAVVFDVSERLDDFLKYKAPLSKIVFEYYAGFVPFYLNMLSPLINFIAVIFFTAKMADQTEIVPILSGGMSFNRFIRPYMVAATIIFALNFVFSVYIIPRTNKLKVGFERVYVKPVENNTKSSTHMQIDDDSYVYIDNFDNNRKVGYNFVLEKFDGNEMIEKLMADRIAWDSVKNHWRIENYTIRKIDSLDEEMIKGTSMDTLLDMTPRDFEVYDNIFTAMNMTELNERIEKEKIRGTGMMTDLLLEKYKRFVTPLAAYVLTLMGVALSSKKVRGGIGLSLGIGIGLSFTYIVFIQFATMFSLKGGLPPIIAVFIPNLIFGALAFYLLHKAPK